MIVLWFTGFFQHKCLVKIIFHVIYFFCSGRSDKSIVHECMTKGWQSIHIKLCNLLHQIFCSCNFFSFSFNFFYSTTFIFFGHSKGRTTKEKLLWYGNQIVCLMYSFFIVLSNHSMGYEEIMGDDFRLWIWESFMDQWMDRIRENGQEKYPD